MKYELSRQSTAVALFTGLYVKRKFSRRIQESLAQGKLSLMLLYLIKIIINRINNVTIANFGVGGSSAG